MDLADIRFIGKTFIKERGRGFLEKSAHHPFCDSRLKLQCHLIHALAIWKQTVNVAGSSVGDLLFITYRCWQRHYEQIWNLLPRAQWTFKPRMLLFSLVNGAMNSSKMAALQREWGTSVQSLKKPTQVQPIPMPWWILFPRWELVSELPTTVWGGADSLKGSHNMGDGQIFLNISAPLSLRNIYCIKWTTCWIVPLNHTIIFSPLCSLCWVWFGSRCCHFQFVFCIQERGICSSEIKG